MTTITNDSIHARFFQQALKTPDAIGVRDSQGVMTYSEILKSAVSMAKQLKMFNLDKETPIGVYFPRNKHLVSVLLGIMAADCSYLPLDSKDPITRTRQLIDITNAKYVVTTVELAKYLPEKITPIFLESSKNTTGDLDLEQLCHSFCDQLAYFIFTSGSNGVPKAVMIEHRNAISLFEWASSEYSRSDLSQVAAGTSITFDLSVFEIFVPLTTGGCIHVLEDALSIVSWPWREEITLINTVPSIMAEILNMKNLSSGIRVINLAGERFSKRLFEEVRGQFPKTRIYNLYGPSEDTTYSTVDCVSDFDATPTIGRSLMGRNHYIIDDTGNEVNQGEVGEIYVSGPGVARGYFQRPDLNIAFRPDLKDPENQRMYRTGDFGRHLPDGRLLYLGRRDDQIKIRGHRIEIGEIYAVLLSHPQVIDVAIVVIENVSRGKFLRCAILKKNKEETGLQEVLTTFLQSRLPSYMHPGEWIVTDELPRLPNGKVDRSKISKMDVEPSRHSGQSPIGFWEIQLSQIWQDILKASNVYRDDTFLGLGGSSLLVVRLAIMIKERLGVQVLPATLFAKATLREQAFYLECTHSSNAFSQKQEIKERVEISPCTDSQLRMWTLDQIIPNSPRYNIVNAFQICGSLDKELLAFALKQIVIRHPILSVKYQMIGDQLFQMRQPAQMPQWEIVELQNSNWDQSWIEAVELGAQFVRRPFEMDGNSWLRILTVSVSEVLHLLVIVTHHIAADGSVDLILRDFENLYNNSQTLDDLEAPDYLSYSSGLKDDSENAQKKESIEYWKKTFETPLEPLKLPFDKRPQKTKTGNGRLIVREISHETYLSLRTLCSRNGVSLFQGLLAICWMYFSRLCDTQDVTLVAPFQNRPISDYSKTVGNFVNTVLLRGNLTSTDNLIDVFQLSRTCTTEAIIHGAVPLEEVLDNINGKGNPGVSFSLNVMVSLVETSQDLILGKALSKRISLDLNTSRFELGVFFQQSDKGLELHLEYNSDHFSNLRAQSIIRHLLTFFEAAIENEMTSWRKLPLLSESDVNLIVHQWNQTSAPYPRDVLMQQLFELSVDQNPNQIAVKSDEFVLTYLELERLSNQLAHTLIDQGLTPRDRIAILCDRTPWMIVSVLGILKAGCVYVPFDPEVPRDRHLKMLKIAEVKAIVHDNVYLNRAMDLSADLQSQCLTINLHSPVLKDGSDKRMESKISSNDLAYIIFTSGTTGIPKAVFVRHQPVINLIDWVNKKFRVGNDDQLLFVTSLAFDLSVYDIFGILAAGGVIRVVSAKDVRDPSQLAKIITEEPITFWDSAPIALDQCITYLKERASQTMRLAFLSGDWVPVNLFGKLKKCLPQIELIALGGATEAVIWSNFYKVEQVDPFQTSIPYGKPIQNARYYILDNELLPVPIGVEGNLYIGGEVLAEGYLGDQEKTAKQFVIDPFGAHSHSRMYRTGDRARFFEDGNIEFRGRNDNQVKVNGYRIEVGEIESVLLSQPEVETAHVAIKGEKHQFWLCAYVVAKGPTENLTDLFRIRLREKLPEYMMPSTFIFLDVLPLSRNGKLDRHALPEPSLKDLKRQKNDWSSNREEETIKKIWQEILQHDDFGVNDNFFDVGGNSARLIMTHRKIETFSERAIPITTLFQHTTIKALAAHLRSQENLDVKEDNNHNFEIGMRGSRGVRRRGLKINSEESDLSNSNKD